MDKQEWTPEERKAAESQIEHARRSHDALYWESTYRGQAILLRMQLTSVQAQLAAMTEDRDLWQDAHGEDCPYMIRAKAAESRIAAQTSYKGERPELHVAGWMNVEHYLREDVDPILDRAYATNEYLKWLLERVLRTLSRFRKQPCDDDAGLEWDIQIALYGKRDEGLSADALKAGKDVQVCPQVTR